MSDDRWVWLLAVAGSVTLALSALRGRQVGFGRGLFWLMLWLGLFFVVAAVFTALDRA